MVKRTRWHIAVICVTLTSIVVAIALTGQLYYSYMISLATQKSLMSISMNAIVSKIMSDSSVNYVWMDIHEIDNQQVIFLYINDTPLFYKGGWVPQTERGILRELALTISDDVTEELSILIKGQYTDSYWLGIQEYTLSDGSVLKIHLLQDRHTEVRAMYRQIYINIIILLVSIASLIGVAWFLSGVAIRPLLSSIKKQNQFIAAVSHELRSPFALILSSAEALCLNTGKTEQYVNNIISECKRVGRLVDDMLVLIRPPTTMFNCESNQIEVYSLLISVVEQYQPYASSNGFKLVLKMEDEILPNVFGDSDRLKQLFFILFNNIVDHSGTTGNIYIAVRKIKQAVRFQVVDNGVGINSAQVEHIYDMFYQCDQSRTQKKNSGLGLSVAAKIATMHGTKIVYKNTPDGGATFQFDLNVVSKEQRT